MDAMRREDLGVLLLQQPVVREENVSVFVQNVLHRETPLNALAEDFDHLTVFRYFADQNAVFGAAVEFADDYILRHVHQTAGQVAGVRGTSALSQYPCAPRRR